MVVHRGQPVKVSVRTPSLAACLAEARYSDGSRQSSGIKHAHDGLVTWMVRVPNNAALGQASLVGSLRRHLAAHRHLAREAGDRDEGRLDAAPAGRQAGLLQRPDKLGTGSTVSYGLLLEEHVHHAGRDRDATC